MPDEDSEVISVAPDGRPAINQPPWRRDFPFDWPEDEYRSRREFVAFLMLTSAAFVAGQFWILLMSCRGPIWGECIVPATKAGSTFATANLWLDRHGVHCRESVWKCARVKCSRMVT
jgi:hypothetical protein